MEGSYKASPPPLEPRSPCRVSCRTQAPFRLYKKPCKKKPSSTTPHGEKSGGWLCIYIYRCLVRAGRDSSASLGLPGSAAGLGFRCSPRGRKTKTRFTTPPLQILEVVFSTKTRCSSFRSLRPANPGFCGWDSAALGKNLLVRERRPVTAVPSWTLETCPTLPFAFLSRCPLELKRGWRAALLAAAAVSSRGKRLTRGAPTPPYKDTRAVTGTTREGFLLSPVITSWDSGCLFEIDFPKSRHDLLQAVQDEQGQEACTRVPKSLSHLSA